MQDQPSHNPTPRVAPQGTPEYAAQRRLLLELVVDPPTGGDHVADVAQRLDLSPEAIEAAAAVLQDVGLAWRIGRRLAASPSAIAFEALWRLRP